MSLNLVRFEEKFSALRAGRIWEAWSPLVGVYGEDLLKSEYDIETLYFDDADLNYLHQAFNGQSVKHKFRLRRYPASGDIFWERKSKFNGRSDKTRRQIHANATEFIASVGREMGLTPKCFVRYRRIVWRHRSKSIAFNIDFAISGVNQVEGRGFRRMEPVFEIKYAQPHEGDQLKRWLGEELGLKRISFSKYLYGMSDGRIE